MILTDILSPNYKTQGSQFKAMLATNSKVEAIRYLKHFEEAGDLNAAVVISPPDQREGYDAVDEESQDLVKRYWDKMMEKYGNEENYEESIKDEFVNGDELDLLFLKKYREGNFSIGDLGLCLVLT